MTNVSDENDKFTWIPNNFVHLFDPVPFNAQLQKGTSGKLLKRTSVRLFTKLTESTTFRTWVRQFCDGVHQWKAPAMESCLQNSS